MIGPKMPAKYASGCCARPREPAEHLAVPVARDGDPLPMYIEETEKNFAISWTGTHRIDGKAFVYPETESACVRAILGYPIRLILEQTGS